MVLQMSKVRGVKFVDIASTTSSSLVYCSVSLMGIFCRQLGYCY